MEEDEHIEMKLNTWLQDILASLYPYLFKVVNPWSSLLEYSDH